MKNVRLLLSLLSVCICPVDAAFGVHRLTRVNRGGTALNLEDHIADMIDQEVYRLQHLREYEAEWHQKNRAMIEPSLPTELDVVDNVYETVNRVVPIRDKRLAERDPQRYCAERCVKSGYCDVYEDMFDMSAGEVLQFCNECVLSDDEEPCIVPEKMYAGLGDDEEEVEMEGEDGLLPELMGLRP